MSRRKPLAARKPSGQTRAQPQLTPPTEVRRLRDSAIAGMRPPEWGTMLGWLYLSDKITAVQFSVGKRWGDLAAEYSEACCAPPPPRTAQLDAGGGSVLDPDSVKGRREARRHTRMIEGYKDGITVLERTSKLAARTVRDVCERNLIPAGQGEVEALRSGLQALAAFWSSKSK